MKSFVLRTAIVVCAGVLLAGWGCDAGTSGGGGAGDSDNRGAQTPAEAGAATAGRQEGPVDIKGTWDVVYTVQTVDVQTGRAVGDQWHGIWQITETAGGELTLASEAGTMTSAEIVSVEGVDEWQGRAYMFNGDTPFELETSGNAIYVWSLSCWADSSTMMHGTIDIGYLICVRPCPPSPADTWTFTATRR